MSTKPSNKDKYVKFFASLEYDDDEAEVPSTGVEALSAFQHRFLTEIGDPHSREGAALKMQYKCLTAPMALAGSFAAARRDLLEVALTREFPWLASVIRQIVGTLALRAYAGNPVFRLDPLLLTGPPGVGKSMFARRIADLAGVPFTSVSCAGSNDNRAFAGTGRGWSSTQPCLPLLAAARFRTANPVILVDEIDKDRKEGGTSGRISDSLLNFLEPETARRYFDESLMAEADLRPVSWICTANSLEGISPVLMSRLHVIEVPAPVLDSQSFPIILAGMKRELASEIGLRVEELPDLPRSVEGALLDLYQKTESLRKLARALRRVLAMAVETHRRALH